MQNKLNLLGGGWSGFASVLEPLWQDQDQESIPLLQHICLCMQGRPPMLVLTDDFFFNYQKLKELN